MCIKWPAKRSILQCKINAYRIQALSLANNTRGVKQRKKHVCPEKEAQEHFFITLPASIFLFSV